jgi:LSD1 subclass zinc finger protein
MEIKVLCPTCKKQLKAPAEMGGKQVKCPQCQTAMVLPAVAQGANQAPPQGAGPKSNIMMLLEEEPFYRLAPAPPSDSPEARNFHHRWPCPFCAELIPFNENKCRYCKSAIDNELRDPQRKKKAAKMS